MKRVWLIFSQAVTVLFAAYFVVLTLKPQWLSVNDSAKPEVAPELQLMQATAQHAQQPVAGSLSAAAKVAAPSVVSINTSKVVRHPYANDPLFQYFFGGSSSQSQSGLGSGVIISADGYLLTNNHVVEGADEITVTLHDGRSLNATIVGTDPESDLAVLRISATGLPSITIGDSDAVSIGDQVLAIGNPFGVGQTVTSGIISATGRSHLGINTFENFIQTDAAINPGNSGGALVDINGNLLGINTAIFSQSGGSMGIGFAIPTSTAQLILHSLLKEGRVVRGWVGVSANDLTPELAQAAGVDVQTGILVTGVLQGGPAERAGIKPGDVITHVGQQEIRNVAGLLTAVAALPPDVVSTFTVYRGKQKNQISVTPAERPVARRNSAQRR